MLPVGPVNKVNGYSPYNSSCSMAGNDLFINPEGLYIEGLLGKGDISDIPFFNEVRVEYAKVWRFKDGLLRKAFENFLNKGRGRAFDKFCSKQGWWLDDYCLFAALKDRYSKGWQDWPDDIRKRHKRAVRRASEELGERVEYEKFKQYLFSRQWGRLRQYCADRGIRLIGDVPIYVAPDSSDIWANPEYFKLDRDLRPKAVAGVPPDYFSDTGQLWGNPVYDWRRLACDGFKWWLGRIGRTLELFDMVRIDHFRGLVAYWEVAAGARTAKNGKWVDARPKEFFDAVMRAFPKMPLIAEDLGVITPDVVDWIERLGLASMKVLQFAFDDPGVNTHIPHNHIRNCIVYTGTHDNNTTRGWYWRELSRGGKKNLRAYTGGSVTKKNVHEVLMRMAMGSVADCCILPVQDVVGLGEKARFNKPATKRGNWQWRIDEKMLSGRRADKLADMVELFGRC
jgi:4-alpha-glucanotransferase